VALLISNRCSRYTDDRRFQGLELNVVWLNGLVKIFFVRFRALQTELRLAVGDGLTVYTIHVIILL
jgi:hypothetical protein